MDYKVGRRKYKEIGTLQIITNSAAYHVRKSDERPFELLDIFFSRRSPVSETVRMLFLSSYYGKSLIIIFYNGMKQ